MSSSWKYSWPTYFYPFSSVPLAFPSLSSQVMYLSEQQQSGGDSSWAWHLDGFSCSLSTKCWVRVQHNFPPSQNPMADINDGHSASNLPFNAKAGMCVWSGTTLKVIFPFLHHWEVFFFCFLVTTHKFPCNGNFYACYKELHMLSLKAHPMAFFWLKCLIT